MQVVPNQLVELHLTDSGGQQVFRTRVEDVAGDLLTVGVPIVRGNLVPIRIGTHLVLEFKISDSTHEGRFRAQAVVEARSGDNLPSLRLRLLEQWKKIQERWFVRIPVFLDAVFMILAKAGVQLEQELPPQGGVILNLSGGGFLLRSRYPFDLNDEIKISFLIEDEQIKAKAQLVRFVPTDNEPDFGFQFTDLSEQLRTTIIKCVYQRQIELADKIRNERK